MAKLLALNREFYQTFAGPFAEKRTRLQPGVQRALARIAARAAVLDLGCGNGQVARALAKAGHQGEYVGVDASVQMLAIASQDCPHPHATFLHADLASPAWAAALEGRFDEILAFAVLHHLPGSTLRLRLTRQLHELLSPNGRLTLSVWNFSASSRLMKRIVPWEDVNLQAEDVDAGDALIDWRHGGRGLRYVHQFSVQELEALAQQACFAVDETYHSDGEGGRLGLYQVWLPAPQAQQE